jgi:hypothetical protein
VERSLHLLSSQGHLAFILPHKFFNAQYGEPLRGLISEGKHLSKVVHFGDQQIFEGATTYTCLMVLDKGQNPTFEFEKITDLRSWRDTKAGITGIVNSDNINSSEWNITIGKDSDLFKKLGLFPVRLGNIANIFVGLQTSADTVFLFKEFNKKSNEVYEVHSSELDEWVHIESAILKSIIRSGSIKRYKATPTALALFPYEVINNSARLYSSSEIQTSFPLAWNYLVKNRKLLENREQGKFKDSQWYRFGRTQNIGIWEQQKLMVPYMITELSAYSDISDNYYFINVTTGGFGITYKENGQSLQFLCGLLNSKLLDYFFKKVTTNFNSGYFAANKQYIEQLPIRTIDFNDPTDAARHGRMVELVEAMLELHRRLGGALPPQEQESLRRRIEATDRAIDALVYELYGLTAEEIQVVEGG